MDTESARIFDRMRLHKLMEQHPNWLPAPLRQHPSPAPGADVLSGAGAIHAAHRNQPSGSM